MDIQLVDNINIYWKQIFHALKRASRPILEDLELTKVDANILLALSGKQKKTKSELAASLSFEPNSLTRSLDRLTELGAINRELLDDKRFIQLSLTIKGEKIAQHYINHMRTIWLPLLNSIDKQELNVLVTVLQKIVSNLNEEA